MVVIASPPITTSPPTIDQRAEHAGGGSGSCSTNARQQQAEQRGARRLDHAGVAERHQQEAGIADDAKCRGRRGSSSAMPRHQPMPLRSPTPSRRNSGSSRTPAQTQRWKVMSAGENADVDAVPRGGEADRPEDRRAGAAEDADGAGAERCACHAASRPPSVSCPRTRASSNRRPRRAWTHSCRNATSVRNGSGAFADDDSGA